MTHWNDPPARPLRLPSIPPRLARWLPWIAFVVIALGAANFLWFIADSASLGGDALNG
jgi:hypothetical protein